jgi:hypothetical protein
VRSTVGRITALSFVAAALIGAGLGRQMASGHDPALAHKAKARVAHVSPARSRPPRQSHDTRPQTSTPAPAQPPAPVVTRSS